MTYHMQCARRSLDFGERSKLQFDEEVKSASFPLKLWQIANDKSSEIIEWSDNGKAIIINEIAYERNVLTQYPGFVKIPTFANLRRQLREYGFDWRINEGGELEFFNGSFTKDSPENLQGVLTKRKTLTDMSYLHSPLNGAAVRRRRGRPRLSESSTCTPVVESDFIVSNSLRGFQNSVDVSNETQNDHGSASRPRFPNKLWEVTNDAYPLLVWGCDGISFHVNSVMFEAEVAEVYPGFVQTSSFLNFRRLMREYGFSWKYRPDEAMDFEFSHLFFLRDHPECLCKILTKRKRHIVKKWSRNLNQSPTPDYKPILTNGRNQHRRSYHKSKLLTTPGDQHDNLQAVCKEGTVMYDPMMVHSPRVVGYDGRCDVQMSSPDDVPSRAMIAFGDGRGSVMHIGGSYNPTRVNATKPREKVKIPVYFWNDDVDYSAHLNNDTSDNEAMSLFEDASVFGGYVFNPQVNVVDVASNMNIDNTDINMDVTSN